jgi:hypothetical protein
LGFWGLYVHVCKMETLREAYQMARSNDGAPGIDGVTSEAIEEGGGERRHGKEIHRSDGFSMIAQKGRPSFCRIGMPWRFPHPAQHSPFRNVEGKHLQFAMNPWRVPRWIVRNHAEDEFAEFNADALPTYANAMPRARSNTA